MSAIALHGLTKVFHERRGPVVAVDHVDLCVEAGERLVLLGPSGCGKTTLLRLIAGLDQPTAGRVAIGGRDVTHFAPHQRGLALVPQEHALFPHLTVGQNLGFGLRMRRAQRGEVRCAVAETAGLLHIEHLIDRRPAGLSGGEARRVALGRALATRPDLLLLDEPLASLDARLRSRLRDDIRRLHRERPLTILHVTHDQDEAMALGQRIAVMRAGAILQSATPDEVYDRPASRFVAEFLGSPPMNLIDGRLIHDGGTARFEAGELRLQLPPGAAQFRERESRASQQPAWLGLRSEDILCEPAEARSAGPAAGDVGRAAPPDHPILRVTVTHVCCRGQHCAAHVVTASGQHLITTAPRWTPAAAGQQARVVLNMARAHLFAAGEPGLRLN